MSNYIIITSLGRKLNLPVKFSEMHIDANEEVVSTNAPHGMLFVHNKVVQSYFTVEKHLLTNGSLVCVPLIEDFKNQEKQKILKQLENIDIM